METNEILLLNTSATILAGMLANPKVIFDDKLEPLAVKTALCLMAAVKIAIAENQDSSSRLSDGSEWGN